MHSIAEHKKTKQNRHTHTHKNKRTNKQKQKQKNYSLGSSNSYNYRIVSNKRSGGVAIFQKGDVYKRQVFNAKMQCLSLFTVTRGREI